MSNQRYYPIPPKQPGEPNKASSEPDYEKLIQEAIIQDPKIKDSDHISVKMEKKGALKAGEIHLIGKVSSQEQKQRAEELAEINTPDNLTVVSELVVE